MDRSSVGPKGLFAKAPSFTLENFSSKDFIVRDFVDSLAESAVPANRRSGPAQAAFDPKPLIRTFEGNTANPSAPLPWTDGRIRHMIKCSF